MTPFSFDQLLAPATCIFTLTVVLSFLLTRAVAFSIAAAFIKTGIYVIYFSVIFDGTYTFFDDWTYLDRGLTLFKNGITLTNLISNWEYVLMVGQGEHILYYLVNSYAIRFFGYGYYAPVALNVLISILVGFFGSKLAQMEFRLSNAEKKIFFLFLIFHPDILAWSSLTNLKDILVLFLHILYLMSISLFFKKRYIQALPLNISVTIVLFFLRYYTPFLFIVALFCNQVFRLKIKTGFMMVTLILVGGVFYKIGSLGFVYAYEKLLLNLSNPFIGLIRTFLSPIPFHTELKYSFLNFPMLFHWLTIPFIIQGVIEIRKIKTEFIKYFFYYILCFVVLYTIYFELQGPRHRVQLDFALAIIQFYGIKCMLQRFITWTQKNPPTKQIENINLN